MQSHIHYLTNISKRVGLKVLCCAQCSYICRAFLSHVHCSTLSNAQCILACTAHNTACHATTAGVRHICSLPETPFSPRLIGFSRITCATTGSIYSAHPERGSGREMLAGAGPRGTHPPDLGARHYIQQATSLSCYTSIHLKYTIPLHTQLNNHT